MSIHQRIADRRHERRIRRLGRELARGDHLWRAELDRLWQEYVRAINSRSPEQVARMEKKLGLR